MLRTDQSTLYRLMDSHVLLRDQLKLHMAVYENELHNVKTLIESAHPLRTPPRMTAPTRYSANEESESVILSSSTKESPIASSGLTICRTVWEEDTLFQRDDEIMQAGSKVN